LTGARRTSCADVSFIFSVLAPRPFERILKLDAAMFEIV